MIKGIFIDLDGTLTMLGRATGELFLASFSLSFLSLEDDLLLEDDSFVGAAGFLTMVGKALFSNDISC